MKEYSPVEVALEVLKKYQELNAKKEDIVEEIKESSDIKKAMFSEQKALRSSSSLETNVTKEDCASELKWKVQNLKDLKEMGWTIESEVPEAKEIFEKQYKKIKAQISELIEKYNKLKKSSEDDELTIMAKAEIDSEQCDIEETKLPKLEKEKTNKQVYAQKVKEARAKIEKALNIDKCGEMTKDENNKHFKGVHRPIASTAKKVRGSGISSAGMQAKKRPHLAIEAHKKVLQEQKEMPKPNLPKNEEQAGVSKVLPKLPKLRNFLDRKSQKVAETAQKIGVSSEAQGE